jgi:hypothetical protein
MRSQRLSRRRGFHGLGFLCLFLLGALPGCRITPDAIQRIETENDLLREQIRTMRVECEQYRQLQLDIEPRVEDPPATPPPNPR